MSSQLRASRSQRPKPSIGERGMALIFVVMVILVCTAVVSEFSIASSVDFQIAVNAKDELQAEYNALAAMRMRQVFVREAKPLIDSLAGLLGSDAGTASIQQMLEQLPIDCSLLNLVITMASEDIDADAAKEQNESTESFFEGECLATMQSEHTKLSLNMLASRSKNQTQQMQQRLLTFFQDPRLEHHFIENSDDPNHPEGPENLVGAIVDWVDTDDDQSINPSADEARLYDRFAVPYVPKNAPFDSLHELKMVHGINDQIFEMLKERITIYTPSGQILLTKASYEQVLIFGLMTCLKLGATQQAFLLHPNAAPFAYAIKRGVETRTLKVASIKSLVNEFALNDIFDTQAIQQIFTDKTKESFYTLKSAGMVGNVVRNIRAVYQATEDRLYYIRFEY